MISLASLTLFGGAFIHAESEANYKKCMEVHNDYSYCKVLIYGRWVTNKNSHRVNYTLWEYFCAQNVIVHMYCNKNLDNLLRLILILDSDVESRNL